jgi:hypothetical protein
LGIVLDDKYQTEAYLNYRIAKDNRSGVQNSISQIFEDNVAIYGVGIRAYPWPSIPLQAFLEIGKAEDLIDQQRPKWRGDVRGGLIYYNQWGPGTKPTYTFGVASPWSWRMTLYSDLIYYSRYDHNIIGTVLFRPGYRILTLQSTTVDFYLGNYLIFDKNREFYNNTYSIGPGIAVTPTNRLNVTIRLELLQGYYIPVNSPTPNPYSSRYHNNIAMVEAYFRF